MKSTDSRKGKGLMRRRPVIDLMPYEAYIANSLTCTTQADVDYAKSIPDEYALASHEGVKH